MVLEVKKLSVYFPKREILAVDDVSFSLSREEVLGIVGESGSGKTITSLSVLGLLPEGCEASGEVLFEGKNILTLPEQEKREIRGRKMAIIFQDPQSALNPVLTIGYQVSEPLIVHKIAKKREAYREAEKLLSVVGISDAELRMKNYPHEFSGGMKQRAVIATSISCKPEILIADEPTTALDVTVQSQVLKVIAELVERNSMSLIFISHDIALVSVVSTRICIMYAGWIVEEGETKGIINNPLHPYTKALLGSLPRPGVRIKPISGSPLDISKTGCKFAKRCPSVKRQCFEIIPESKKVDGRMVKCLLYK